MNREHKLGLIIGFAVILLVGLLVGDHFSKSRSQPLSTDLARGDAVALPTPKPAREFTPPQPAGDAASMQPGVNTRLAVNSPAAPEPVLPADESAQAAPPAVQTPKVEPAEITMGGEGSAIKNGTGARRGSEPRSGKAVPANSPINTGIAYEDGKVVSPPAAAKTSSTILADPMDVPGKSGLEPAPKVPSALPVSKGAETRYPVEAGDTLYKLASRFYSDSGLWKKLGEYNKDKIRPDGSNMREGVTLRIPPKDVLLGKALLNPDARPAELAKPANAVAPLKGTVPAPAEGKDKLATSKISPRGDAKEKAAKPDARTYVIKSGDTLSKIASKELGASARWEEISRLNPAVDESDLRVGDTIKLPGK